MSEKCSSCNLKLLRDKFINCEGLCGQTFHKQCVSISEQTLNALQADRNLQWRCNNCASVGPSLFSTIAQLKLDIAEIKTMLSKSKVDSIGDKNSKLSTSKVSSKSKPQTISTAPAMENPQHHTPLYIAPSIASSSSSSEIIENQNDGQTNEEENPSMLTMHTTNRGQRHAKLFGTANIEGEGESLTAIPKPHFVHLSRHSTKVTEEKIISYTARRLQVSENVLRCKIIKKDVDPTTIHFVNFKLGVPAVFIEKAFIPTIWPV